MLATWNPFAKSPITRVSSSAVDLEPSFQTLFFNDPAPAGWRARSVNVPAADVLELENEFLVKVDLPGHDPAKLQLTIEDETLTIASERKQPDQLQAAASFHSERSCGLFSRSFSLPRSVDTTRCEAKLEHGVLTVTLPKREEAKPRSINIKLSS